MQIGAPQADTRNAALKTFKVLTNHVLLSVDRNLVAHHFDVTFSPEIKQSERRRELIVAAVGDALRRIL